MTYFRPIVIIALFAGLACKDPAPGDTDSADPSSSTGSTGSPESTGSTGSTGDPPTGTTGDPPTGTTGAEEWTKICDGSNALRLAMVLGGGGLVENEIERAIGWKYLYVLGTCEFYALPSLEGVWWPDAHTGVMDPATEKALSIAIDYGGLAEIAGSWGTDNLSDASTLVVTDGAVTVSCYGACEQGPPAAQKLWSEMGWITTLWEQGEPLLGPLRISVVGEAGAAPGMPTAPWPLMADPWSIATPVPPEPISDYPTILIETGEDLETLRKVRQQYREDDLPPETPNTLKSHGYLLFHDAGGQDLFKVWIRDALPIEDESGHIPLKP